MRIVPLLAASVVAIGLSTAASPSEAAQLLPRLETNQSLAQPVYWRHHGYWRPGFGGGYCWRWRHICADRWGWGSGRFYRCLAIHGC
jgi:hypothetical protein